MVTARSGLADITAMTSWVTEPNGGGTMFRKKFIAAILILVSLVFLFEAVSFADELAEIQAAIKAKGAKWIAGKTSMMMLTPEERRMRLGLALAKGIPGHEATLYQETFTSVP